jgi:regulator of protease activity HflC (stomatin/prohibitin superfamily)
MCSPATESSAGPKDERGVVFRLRRVLAQARGPGLALVFAPIDRLVRMSLRVEAMEVPAQDVTTRDNVMVKVNAEKP